MIDPIVQQTYELLENLEAQLNEADLDLGITRDQKVVDGQIVFSIYQQNVFEIKLPEAEDQVVAICNLALNRFFKVLKGDLKSFVDPATLEAVTTRHQKQIQNTLITSLPSIEKMRMGVDHALVFCAKYTTDEIKSYNFFLSEYIEGELKKSIFFKTFSIINC